MALCLATSLVEREGFDAHDQMDRHSRWYYEGHLSSTGVCFDIGGTVASALRRYRRTGESYAGSTDPMSAGNGRIMRLDPVPMFFYPDLDAVEQYSAQSSRTTHGAQECVDACHLFGRVICRTLLGKPKDEVVFGNHGRFRGAARIVSIAEGAWLDKDEADIRGSGYVVESLEAALWCSMRTETFEDAILRAANLGDADTSAAVCGQLAGAYYGEAAIPSAWLDRLTMRTEITRLAHRLAMRHEVG